MKLISIIIPVYNEEQFVGQLLEKVSKLDFSHLWYDKELIIVNDGSKDKSEDIIKNFIDQYQGKSHYVTHKNHGKGYSIKQWVLHAHGDVYVIQDADLEYEPTDLIDMLAYMEKNDLDICYGSRTRGYKKYGMNYSTVGFLFWGLVVSALTTLLSRKFVTDEPTCYKMYHNSCRNILLFPKENDFAWEPAVTIMLLRQKYRYGELPIHYYPRKQTQWKKIKLKDGRYAIKTLFVYWSHRRKRHA